MHIETGEYVCSFTIWGAGTTEWIVLEKKTGQDYEVEDSKFASEAELLNKLEEIRSKIDRLVRG